MGVVIESGICTVSKLNHNATISNSHQWCAKALSYKPNFIKIFVNFQFVSNYERESIARCFKNKDFSAYIANNVRVEGETYQFLREMDKKLVLAKKKGSGAITMQASKTAIVIAHCPEGGQQGNTNKGVAVIAEYLESLNMWCICYSVFEQCYYFYHSYSYEKSEKSWSFNSNGWFQV